MIKKSRSGKMKGSYIVANFSSVCFGKLAKKDIAIVSSNDLDKTGVKEVKVFKGEDVKDSEIFESKEYNKDKVYDVYLSISGR